MVKPNEIFYVKVFNEIFNRFLKNPKPLKFLKSVKDTGVAFYYAVRSSELDRRGESKLAEVYNSRASDFLDTWEWLGLKRKPYDEEEKFFVVPDVYRFD